ncbi:MAG TPA: pirin family protein [Candidatus Angelobacter sp.]|jgi:redox-sensitive bicupin YhaK (pirin superfamily)|nr:pirin family protein [Candidatus Angelobacter sp.]
MSGPLTQQDGIAAAAPEVLDGPVLEVTPARVATVGDGQVLRALPRRGRRTVGAWCFADHFGPLPADESAGMGIGPHPHLGLQTVTWVLRGEMLHTDSLGSEQTIRPGQLNIMTAGRGVTHAEQTLDGRGMHGIQLWVAQPEATRHGTAAFEHHADLPRLEVDGTEVTVITGGYAGAQSPARADTALVGVQLVLRGGATTLPLRAEFEHALIVLDGDVQIEDRAVAPSDLAYLGSNRAELHLRSSGTAHTLLLGGEPFESPLLMWWNFVARTREEVDEAYREWQGESERFGTARSVIPRIPAPVPFWWTQA